MAFQVITNLVKMVKARDTRRPFCPAGHWLSEEVNIRADKVPDPRSPRLIQSIVPQSGALWSRLQLRLSYHHMNGKLQETLTKKKLPKAALMKC